jgi:hypothetical protein
VEVSQNHFDIQLRHLSEAHRRCFHVDGGCSRTFSSGTSWGPAVDIFTLMVGAPRPSAPAPPGGGRRRRFHIDGGCSRLPGAHRQCLHAEGGCSQTFSSDTSWGPAVDVFTLIVGTLEPSALAPPGARRRRFHVDGGRSQLPGARQRHFRVDGGRSWTFISGTFWGPAIDVFMLMVCAPGSSTPAPLGGPPSMFSH